MIDEFRKLIPRGSWVHDPFAGPGVRLGKLCDELGCTFTGTEIEPAFIEDPRVVEGDATWGLWYGNFRLSGDPMLGSNTDRLIVTSPAYPNGMADDWDMKDGSKRMTYRSTKKALGDEAPLHENNQGRYGYRGTKRSKQSGKRWAYWRLAGQAAEHWTGFTRILLNVSDFYHHGNEREPVTDTWVGVLFGAGFDVIEVRDVNTKRNRFGANGDVRVESEHIIVAVPRGTT